MRRLAVLAAFWLLAGCRGDTSESPPIRPIRDMANQPKFRPEQANSFFADGRSMRTPVAGTLAQGALEESAAWRTGKIEEGFVARAPVEVDRTLLMRGQERFNIYCSACHDRAGSGRGLVVQRGYPLPTELTSERVREMADGEIFQVITHGIRNMPSHGAQIPVSDRWAIVQWLRVLQRSQNARIEDVPPERRDQIEQEAP